MICAWPFIFLRLQCTDAVSVDVEKQLYKAIHGLGMTCITISKRIALEEFHATHLALGVASPSGWTIEPTQRPAPGHSRD